MARIRSIKPEFFLSEQVAELPFQWRLLFIGLWTQADRAGRLERRPKRLKASIFPYDTVDVEAGLLALQKADLVIAYEVNGTELLWIPTWAKHQQPHIKEAHSVLAPYEHGASTVLAPVEHLGGEGRGADQEGNDPEHGASTVPAPGDPLKGSLFDLWFQDLKALYPKQRITGGETWKVFIDTIRAAATAKEPAPLVWQRMRANLQTQLVGDQWSRDDKQYIPRLDNWLKDGLWEQQHEPAKATAQKAAGDDEFLGYGIPSRSELKRREAQRKAEDEQYERDKAEGKIPASLTAYIEQQKAAKLG